jgi:hypothetical protein
MTTEMKQQIIRAAAILAAFILSATAFAVPPQTQGQKRDWREKLKAEKVAFLTTRMDLTPQEAEKFWPVYNQLEQENHKKFVNLLNSYRELERAIRENAGKAEIEKFLRAYSKAKDESASYEEANMKKYLEILPVEKVAKLYVGEEEFRRSQINRLGKRQENKPQQ